MLWLGFKRIHQDLKMPSSCSSNVGLEKTMAATEFREELGHSLSLLQRILKLVLAPTVHYDVSY